MLTRTIRICLTAALTFPSPLAASSIDIRQDYARPGDVCVFATSFPQWQGFWQHACGPPNECCKRLFLIIRTEGKTTADIASFLHVVKFSGSVSGSISSLGPDKSAGVCQVYTYAVSSFLLFFHANKEPREPDCNGAYLGFLAYPGNDDLPSLGWDNRVASVRCSGLPRARRVFDASVEGWVSFPRSSATDKCGCLVNSVYSSP